MFFLFLFSWLAYDFGVFLCVFKDTKRTILWLLDKRWVQGRYGGVQKKSSFYWDTGTQKLCHSYCFATASDDNDDHDQDRDHLKKVTK